MKMMMKNCCMMMLKYLNSMKYFDHVHLALNIYSFDDLHFVHNILWYGHEYDLDYHWFHIYIFVFFSVFF